MAFTGYNPKTLHKLHDIISKERKDKLCSEVILLAKCMVVYLNIRASAICKYFPEMITYHNRVVRFIYTIKDTCLEAEKAINEAVNATKEFIHELWPELEPGYKKLSSQLSCSTS